MKTLNQIKSLLKSEPGDVEAINPQHKQPVFEEVNDPHEYLSKLSHAWMLDPQNTSAREAIAADKHPLHPDVREKMLQGLAQHTEVRVDPATKNREFLLHRGVSSDEHAGVTTGNNVHHQTASSWTPNYHVAHAFAAENLSTELAGRGEDRSNVLNDAHHNVLSAWIPEHKIATMPAMHLTREQRQGNPHSDEREIIVKPNHFSEIAEPKHRPVHVLSQGSKENPFALKKATVDAFPFPKEETKPETNPAPTPHVKTAIGTGAAAPIEGKTAPIPPGEQKKWGKLAVKFEERRNQEQALKRKNMDIVKEPSETALGFDKNGNSLSDEMYAALKMKPDYEKKLSNGLVHSVVKSPSGTHTYHFLKIPVAKRNKDPSAEEVHVAGLELAHTPQGTHISNVWNKYTHAGMRNLPVLMQYSAKFHNLKNLSMQELDPEIHGVPEFKNHNPEVIKGLRPGLVESDRLPGVSDSSLISNREKTKKAIIKAPFDVYENDYDMTGGKFHADNNKFSDPEHHEGSYHYKNAHWRDPNFTTSHREAAFDKMARDFFGLGKYVPGTTAFVHPTKGSVHSAQEWVEGAENQPYTDKDFDKPADMQKLALMDSVLGNTDRHGGNLMRNPDGTLMLIDHGLTFDIPDSRNVEDSDYVGNNTNSKLVNFGETSGPALEPETKQWIKDLNPEIMARKLKESSVPEKLAGRVLNRLKALKFYLRKDEEKNHGESILSALYGRIMRVGSEDPSHRGPEIGMINPSADAPVAADNGPGIFPKKKEW